MRTGIAAIVICAAMAACGSKKGGDRASAAAAGSGTAAAAGSASGSAAAAGSPTTVAPRRDLPELFAAPFYRSPGGAVTLVVPAAMRGDDLAIQTVDMEGQHLATIGSRMLRLVMVVVTGIQAADATPDAADALLRSSVGLDDAVAATQIAPGVTMRGPDASGRGGGAVVLTGGDDAAIILVSARMAQLPDLLRAVAAASHVGAGVADRQPSQRLDGLYESDLRFTQYGNSVDWMLFDPRGYVSRRKPADAAALDIDAMVAWASLDPTGVAWTYDVSGGKLSLTPVGAGGAAWSSDVAIDGDTLTLGTDTYHRADGLVPDGTLDGAYSYRDTLGADSSVTGGSHKTFQFARTGEVTFESGSAITGNTTDSVGNVTGNLAGNWSDGSFHGHYTIKRGRLLVDTPGDRHFSIPISTAFDRGQPRANTLLIGGDPYNGPS